ncbi:MAG: cytochrome c [Oligoflexia bacterium]|nr:MAG: cytochrome c [Oligoflexia bacterium]
MKSKVIAAFFLSMMISSFASADRIGICAGCHGLDGNITDPLYPKIAGQQLNYMIAELKAYRSDARQTPDSGYMGLLKGYTDEEIRQISEYFAAQTPKPGIVEADEKVIALGKSIYEKGIPAKNVSACAECHGDKAEGRSKTPRLSGQNTSYFVKQMIWYKTGERTGKMMPDLVGDMTEEEIEAVGLYLESI